LPAPHPNGTPEERLAIARSRATALIAPDIAGVKARALSARKTADGINAPSMRAVASVHGGAALYATANAVLVAGMERIAQSRRPSPEMLAMLAEELTSEFRNESLEDINVFIRNVGMGKYDGSEIYATIDTPRLMNWWGLYLEEKAAARYGYS